MSESSSDAGLGSEPESETTTIGKTRHSCRINFARHVSFQCFNIPCQQHLTVSSLQMCPSSPM